MEEKYQKTIKMDKEIDDKKQKYKEMKKVIKKEMELSEYYGRTTTAYRF